MTQHDRRVALVTGANRGIGYTITKGLAEKGMAVVLGARDAHKGVAAGSELRDQGLAVYFELLDVTSEKSIQSAVANIRNQFNRLDV
ncbi:MAG: SDR family NAD(P)-dependent oxidoreductase, partial [Desulfobacterales bacterium]